MKALRLVMLSPSFAGLAPMRRCELSTAKPTFRPIGKVYPPQTRTDFCCPAGLDPAASGDAFQALAPSASGPPDQRKAAVSTPPLLPPEPFPEPSSLVTPVRFVVKAVE